jgi:predicted metal-binding protein
MAVKITICEGCRATDGPMLGVAMIGPLRAAVAGIADVVTTDCMVVCGAPVSVSVRAPGKAAYLFSGVDLETQIENLATFVRLYAQAPDGIVGDVRPCGDLRFRLVGRIPA